MNSFNKINIRKLLAMLCIIVICISGISVSVPVFAQTENETKECVIAASSKTVERGNEFSIIVDIKNNPGIWGLKFKVSYDHTALTLTSVKNGTVFDDEDTVLPSTLDKEEFVYLAYLNSLKNNTDNGTIVTLNFTVNEAAEFKPYIIGVNVTQAINVDSEDITLKANDGAVSVVKCIHVNDTKWDFDADTHWHNCVYEDCKEKIVKTVEKHKAVAIPAVKATCTKSGLTAGTKCSVCGYVIKKQQIVKAKGHTVVKLRAVKATTERTGLTSGKKCKVCGKILVAQKVIAKLPYKMQKAAKVSVQDKMYKKKSTSSKVVSNLVPGKKVTIVDIKKSWYLIKYNGKLGYVKSTSIVFKGTVITKKGKLRVRSGAGKKYPIISSYKRGTKVTVIGNTSKGWYKVRIKDKKKDVVGYMSAKYIKL